MLLKCNGVQQPERKSKFFRSQLEGTWKLGMSGSGLGTGNLELGIIPIWSLSLPRLRKRLFCPFHAHVFNTLARFLSGRAFVECECQTGLWWNISADLWTLSFQTSQEPDVCVWQMFNMMSTRVEGKLTCYNEGKWELVKNQGVVGTQLVYISKFPLQNSRCHTL